MRPAPLTLGPAFSHARRYTVLYQACTSTDTEPCSRRSSDTAPPGATHRQPLESSVSHKNVAWTAVIALGVVVLYSKYGSKAGNLGMRHGA